MSLANKKQVLGRWLSGSTSSMSTQVRIPRTHFNSKAWQCCVCVIPTLGKQHRGIPRATAWPDSLNQVCFRFSDLRGLLMLISAVHPLHTHQKKHKNNKVNGFYIRREVYTFNPIALVRQLASYLITTTATIATKTKYGFCSHNLTQGHSHLPIHQHSNLSAEMFPMAPMTISWWLSPSCSLSHTDTSHRDTHMPIQPSASMSM